jgi:hypothetical protein
MGMTVRLRYDGKVFVPETPVDLRENDVVEVSFTPHRHTKTQAEREAAIDRLEKHGVHGVNLPDEALSRESIYEDGI